MNSQRVQVQQELQRLVTRFHNDIEHFVGDVLSIASRQDSTELDLQESQVRSLSSEGAFIDVCTHEASCEPNVRRSQVSNSPSIKTLPASWPASLQVRFNEPDDDVREDFKISDLRKMMMTTSPVRLGSSSQEVIPSPSPKRRILCIMSPNSVVFCAWNFLSTAVLVSDLFITPFAIAWDSNIVGFIYYQSLASSTFWTADIVLRFFTSIYRDGELETSLAEIARSYIRQTFFIDVAVSASDWFSILVTVASNSSSVWGAGQGVKMIRFIKIGRLTRIACVFRLSRVCRTLQDLLEQSLSDYSLLMIYMIQVLLVLLWLSHMLACCWFSLGQFAPSNTGRNWLDEAVYANATQIHSQATPLYQYVTSFHWAIAQITLGAWIFRPPT